MWSGERGGAEVGQEQGVRQDRKNLAGDRRVGARIALVGEDLDAACPRVRADGLNRIGRRTAICIREAKKEGHDTFSVVLRLLALGSTMSAERVWPPVTLGGARRTYSRTNSEADISICSPCSGIVVGKLRRP